MDAKTIIAPSTQTDLSPFLREEHQMLRDQVHRFVEEEIKPNGELWESQGYVPRDALRKMGALGFFGIRHPEAFGGSAMDSLATAVWAEELGKSTFAGVAITALVHTDMASVHLVHAGTETQQAKYLPGIIAGEIISAIAITEPDAGSDVKSIRTRATRGPGGYRLNGSKIFITNGVHADLYVVAARLENSAPEKGFSPTRSVTLFLVEKGMPGFSVARELDKLGWRSSDTAELVFDDVFVPEENLLGGEGRGFYAIMKNFQNERLVLGAMAMGEAQAALALTLNHVKTRQAFGAPLWSKEAIRQRLAMLSARVEAGRNLVYHTAWLDAGGRDCVKEVSMVKAYCGELVNDVMYDCLQFHGGSGYMMEAPINRMARDARVQAIGGGATEVMLEEIAKRL